MYVAFREIAGTLWEANNKNYRSNGKQESLAILVYRPPLPNGIYDLQLPGFKDGAIDPAYAINAVRIKMAGPAWRLLKPFHWQFFRRRRRRQRDRLVLYVDRHVRVSYPNHYRVMQSRASSPLRVNQAKEKKFYERLLLEERWATEMVESEANINDENETEVELGQEIAQLSEEDIQTQALLDMSRQLEIMIIRVQSIKQIPSATGAGVSSAVMATRNVFRAEGGGVRTMPDLPASPRWQLDLVQIDDTLGGSTVAEMVTTRRATGEEQLSEPRLVKIEIRNRKRPAAYFVWWGSRPSRGKVPLTIIADRQNVKITAVLGQDVLDVTDRDFNAIDLRIRFVDSPFDVPRPGAPLEDWDSDRRAAQPYATLAESAAFEIDRTASEDVESARLLLDLAVGMIPYVGDAVDIGELGYAIFSGRDRWGRSVSNNELIAFSLFAALPFASGSVRRVGNRLSTRARASIQEIVSRVVGTLPGRQAFLRQLRESVGTAAEQYVLTGRFGYWPYELRPDYIEELRDNYVATQAQHIFSAAGVRPAAMQVLNPPTPIRWSAADVRSPADAPSG